MQLANHLVLNIFAGLTGNTRDWDGEYIQNSLKKVSIYGGKGDMSMFNHSFPSDLAN